MNKIENPNKIRKICVYCGSGPGTDPAFIAAATALGTLELARSAHAAGGDLAGDIGAGAQVLTVGFLGIRR